jgi:hypothetical protein
MQTLELGHAGELGGDAAWRRVRPTRGFATNQEVAELGPEANRSGAAENNCRVKRVQPTPVDHLRTKTRRRAAGERGAHHEVEGG